jgi:hypothetical protein
MSLSEAAGNLVGSGLGMSMAYWLLGLNKFVKKVDAEPVMQLRDCGLTGHHYEGRFDEEPLLMLTAAEVMSFQGKNTSSTTAYRSNCTSTKVDTVYIPAIAIADQLRLVEAHKKKTYVADVCRYCGKTQQYDRSAHHVG